MFILITAKKNTKHLKIQSYYLTLKSRCVLNKALISEYVFGAHSLQSVLHISATQISIE